MILTAKWLLPIRFDPIENGALSVNGDRIKAVGTIDEIKARYPEEEVKDFGAAIIMPGMVNTHSHLEYSVYRGVFDDCSFSSYLVQIRELNQRMDENDLIKSASLGALESITSGITTVADMSRTGASLRSMMAAGLRGVLYREIIGMDDDLLDQSLKEAKNKYEQSVNSTNELIEIGIAPHAPYTVSAKLFKELCDWARLSNIKIAVHLAESADELNFIEHGSGPLATYFWDAVGWGDLIWQPTGVSPVRYLLQWGVFDSDILAVHCVILDENDMDILSKHRVSIAHCPKSNAKLGCGIAPLTELFERGFRLGLGTDSPASSNIMDFFDEMRVGILLHRGKTRSVDHLTSETFIKMGTIGGAEALKLDSEIGSLEPGKKADVIAIDLSHSQLLPITDPYSALVYGANQDDVFFTMIDGKILYDGYQLKHLDEEKIIEEVKEVRNKLII